MRRKWTSQKGASAVEFALVLPILTLLTFGIIEFSVYLYNQQVITNASREAARAGIVSQSPRVTVADISNVATNYTQNHLITFGTQNTPTVSVTGYDSNALFGTDLTIQVNYNYSFLVIPNFIAIGTLGNMQATTVMRYE